MTLQDVSNDLLNKLRSLYPEGESTQITDWVMEHMTGSKKILRNNQTHIMTPEDKEKLLRYTERLLRHEPVQYVLNESWFGGLKFYVDKNVLIPRPETEELVEWIITDGRLRNDELRILDIGSGSGCIPVCLKRRLEKAEVWSCDISTEALTVAGRNAETLKADVHFVQLDFLQAEQRDQLPSFDFIVSNPPYVPEKDKEKMEPNVLHYEPFTALFVPDNDPLIFYRSMAVFGKTHLKPAGTIYCEIHEAYHDDVVSLFKSHGYSTACRKDMQQKYRMLKADKNEN